MVAQVWWRKLVAQVVAQVGGGRQALVHEFWGAEQTSQWWRKLVVAQVGGGARWFWWRKFGAGWLGASLAQVALKLGAETCATKPTCAKLAPPPTCAKLAPPPAPPPTCATTCATTGWCIHKVALHPKICAPTLVCHHQLAPPLAPPTCATKLVPPPGGASSILLCTPDVVHQHLSVPPTLVPRPTCDTNLCHHHPASAHPKPCLGEVGSEGEGRGTETFHGGMQHLSVIQGLCGAGWGGVGAISVFPDSNPCRSHFGYTRTCPSPYLT